MRNKKEEFVPMKKEESAKFLKLCLADSLLKMMSKQKFYTININAVCEQAGVGRTTYYRYFDKKGNLEDLLVFKIVFEARSYSEKHSEEKKKDWAKVFLNFVYENRELFRLMYKNDLTTSIMKAFDLLSDWKEERKSAYLRAFFVYAFFGVVYQWIKYDFDETPEQIQQHTAEAIMSAVKQDQAKDASQA